MDITMIKNLIYNLLYLAANYDLILTIAPNETVKNQLHNYSSDCKNNATFLDKLYQELNTTSFFPLPEKPEFHGNFKQSTMWLLKYTENAYRIFHLNSYNNKFPDNQIKILKYISGNLINQYMGLCHIILTK